MENLETALSSLEKAGISIIRRSPVYRTAPVDYIDQPEFLNLACEIRFPDSPTGLLKICQKIEQAMGRSRKNDKGPRVIDIDILYFGNREIRYPGLVIPHPRRLMRRFVLIPLSEIADGFIDPLEQKTILQLLEKCPDTSMVEMVGELLD
jgi:2-amino-4-hydroxy-6-hydroxymethyldihydropteridine diphosphokinase